MWSTNCVSMISAGSTRPKSLSGLAEQKSWQTNGYPTSMWGTKCVAMVSARPPRPELIFVGALQMDTPLVCEIPDALPRTLRMMSYWLCGYCHKKIRRYGTNGFGPVSGAGTKRGTWHMNTRVRYQQIWGRYLAQLWTRVLYIKPRGYGTYCLGRTCCRNKEGTVPVDLPWYQICLYNSLQ